MDILFTNTLLRLYGTRATPLQKQAFLQYAARCYHFYHPAMPQYARHRTNLIFGDPTHAKIILAADYTTPMRRFFPYTHFLQAQWLNALQYLFPLALLFGICLLFTRMLNWPVLSALCCFLPLALAACTAFANVKNHNAASGLIALHALAQQHPEACIVLADGTRGMHMLAKAYPHTPILQLQYVGRGNIPILHGTTAAKRLFANIQGTLHGKAALLRICLGEQHTFGVCAGAIGTPQDDTLLEQSVLQAVSFTNELLNAL